MNPAILDDMSWAMAEVYASVTDRILINLAHYFPYVVPGGSIPGAFEYQARMLAQMGQVNRETVEIIAQSLGGADDALRMALETAIMEGLKSEEPALRQAAAKGFLNTPARPQLQPGMTQAFQSYYRQSADRLNLVNTVMLESTQAAYTATVADIANRIQATQSMLNVAAGEVVTGVSAFNQALHGAVNKMVQNGLTGFVDHAGRHWSPEAYVAMDIRTTTANTARQAVFDRNQEYGNDLYLVSSHDGARPLCYPWQGKIISTTGRKGTTTDLDGNTYTIHSEDEIESFRYGGGLFGVNCGHYPMVWIPGFSTMKGQPQDEEANVKQYEESQQQRALERKLREEKRDLEVMKAQGAPEEQIRAQRERVRNASADIDDFCEQTGRARHRDREGAPVRATWPDPDTYDPALFPTQQRDATIDALRRGPASQPVENVASQVTQATENVVESTKGVADVATFKELRQYMDDTYGINVTSGVGKLDLDLTRQALGGFESVAREYPEVAKPIERIRVGGSGVMSCNGQQITFKAEYYTSREYFESTAARNVKSGFWVPNASAGSIGAHETAHALEGVLIDISGKYPDRTSQVLAWNNCTEARLIVQEACDNLRKLPEFSGMDNAEMIQGISRYAYKGGASEAMAEAFADTYANGENANPLSREIRKVTKERYLQYKGGTQ